MPSSLPDAYARAERLLPGNAERLGLGGDERPRFLPGGDRLCLRRPTADGERWLLADPDAGTLEELTERPAELPHEPGVSISPDGRWAVRHEGFDLWLRDRRSGEERALTSDGSAERPYGHPLDRRRVELERRGLTVAPQVVWSADSRALAFERLDQSRMGGAELLELRADEPRAHLRTLRYALPGDAEVARSQLFVATVEDGALVAVAIDPVPVTLYPLLMRPSVRWSGGGSQRLEVVVQGRDHRDARLFAVDAASGAARLVLEERGATTVETAPLMLSQPPLARVLADGRALWWSERDGWGHLWLVDGERWTQLTRGEWVVRDLLRVDETAGTVLFTASGREPGGGPYDRRLYRVALDGGEPELLDGEPLDHELTVTPSGRWLVDAMSSVEQPGRIVLRDGDGDGAIARELDRVDATALRATGWRPPLRFTVTAADGETPLHGLLHLPSTFSEQQRWPLVDVIYPGPQVIRAAVRFGLDDTHSEALAELGCVAMRLDAHGSPLRSKAFRDAHDGLSMTTSLADHAAAVAQLAQRHAWIDADRVAIVGHSGGGHAAVRGMLDRPDVFAVGVAGVGNHDNRRYNAGWGERYLGLLEDDPAAWAAQSNVARASELRGRLLLGLCEMDVNVLPANTRALIAALVAADVDHDVVVLPDHDHWVFDSPYLTRRIWDHLVRHLLGEQPPPYRIDPASLLDPPI